MNAIVRITLWKIGGEMLPEDQETGEKV